MACANGFASLVHGSWARLEAVHHVPRSRGDTINKASGHNTNHGAADTASTPKNPAAGGRFDGVNEIIAASSKAVSAGAMPWARKAAPTPQPAIAPANKGR